MTSDDTAPSPPRGRPRDARVDRSIQRATLELVAEHGVHNLRVDDVACRAGVGKAAIYRRFRTKEQLVGAAVADVLSDVGSPDTGSTRGDLLALMQGAVEVYRDPVIARAMPILVAAMQDHVPAADAVRAGLLSDRRALLRAILSRGVARGELREDLDYELALDVLGGPLFYRLLITGGPVDDRLARGVVTLVLRGFAPPRATCP